MSQQLVLEAITKRFGSLHAVNNINLTIEHGEFLCFLGPSGCGKTTLLRIITGFEHPTSGAIYYDGKRIDRVIPQKREFGIVFQSYALFPNMTVRENIEFGLKMRKMPKAVIAERINEILRLVGLLEWKDYYPSQLSGGQQQRVALGRALAIKPKVLLLDEPLSALDAKIRVRLRTVIKRLQQDLGVTMIYVTHDQEEALAMSDRIVIMNEGEIKQIGTPWEIYQNPGSQFVAEFVGTSNFIVGKRQGEKVCFGERAFRVTGCRALDGETVHLAIRPEKIVCLALDHSHQSYPASNCVEVTAEVITFLGAIVQITFTLEGIEMNVDLAEAEFIRKRIKRGDRLKLFFPEAAFHVFRSRPHPMN